MICGQTKEGPLRFGDQVRYLIPGPNPAAGGGYVVGEMAYSTAGDVVLLATEDTMGMPIAAGHCWVFKPHRTIADVEAAARMRERYVRLFRDTLKPLEADPT